MPKNTKPSGPNDKGVLAHVAQHMLDLERWGHGVNPEQVIEVVFELLHNRKHPEACRLAAELLFDYQIHLSDGRAEEDSPKA